MRKAVERKVKGRSPMPYGFNYAIHIGKDGRVVEALNAINPLLFVREESEIVKVAIATGLAVNQLVSYGAFVFTRSDLIRSRAEWREFKGASMDTKTKYYKRNYPGIDFSPNSNGR